MNSVSFGTVSTVCCVVIAFLVHDAQAQPPGYYPQPGIETACLNFAIDFFNKYSGRPMRAGPLTVDSAKMEMMGYSENMPTEVWYRFLGTLLMDTSLLYGNRGGEVPIMYASWFGDQRLKSRWTQLALDYHEDPAWNNDRESKCDFTNRVPCKNTAENNGVTPYICPVFNEMMADGSMPWNTSCNFKVWYFPSLRVNDRLRMMYMQCY